MQKIAIIILSLLFAVSGFTKTASITKARVLADHYFSSASGKVAKTLENSFSVQYNGTTVYHVFNYQGGGFVVVAATYASTPILAQSDEGSIDENITNPAAKYWFESYSKEIEYIIKANLDNTETLKQWDSFGSTTHEKSVFDAGPLLTTEWSQDQWYNYYCPLDPGGRDGHAPAGCVATAMAQIMKYYNFPERGILSHSYHHPIYGIQTANFQDSVYHWDSMGSSASSDNYKDIAALLYQVGVSVEMNYGPDKSGADTEKVPLALTNFFNYDTKSISIAKKANYTDDTWKELLKSELNVLRPVLYNGFGSVGGHAWVCDGWRSGDDMFHMNWGWSGKANGWYHIGQLNTFGGSYNNDNSIVKGIKPGNPDLIVRMINLTPNQLIACSSSLAIDCSVIKGTPIAVNLYIDNNLVYTSDKTKFTYNLQTAGYSIGSHILKVEAVNSADTVYHEVVVRNSEWISQASAFAKPSRGISCIHAVDSLVVWATAYDESSGNYPNKEFTHTENGGETWESGIISGCDGLGPSMIFALNADTVFCPMYRQSGTNPQGIYGTMDGGNTWSRQTSASFSDPASFPNVVHFFDRNNGFCFGDPIGGEYEIYTTSNGGNSWIRVSADSIPNPLSDETGIAGFYSAIGDNAWFGTTRGRVFRTNDRGRHWEASPTLLNGYINVDFADPFHGLAHVKSNDMTGALSETFDGGVTWTLVKPTGPIGSNDICFVPGTENTWVSTGNPDYGVFYSTDGGHSWEPFVGNENDQMIKIDFVSPETGWAGGFNASATDGGIYKFVGKIKSKKFFNPATELVAKVTGKNINLEWKAPASDTFLGYNVYRNDTLLTEIPVNSNYSNDLNVSFGKHTYCVVAVYPDGKSEAACIDASVLSPVKNLVATVIDYRDVKLEWNTPVAGNEVRYNVMRNSILLNTYPLNRTYYTDEAPYDSPIIGKQTYCLVAVYPSGNSEPKCTDIFMPSPVTNLTANVTGRNVILEWNAPAPENFLGFNVFRNDNKLNDLLIQSASYSDNQVTYGKQTYCVLSIFTTGVSELVCTEAFILTGIPENELLVNVYPIPSTEMITIESSLNFKEVSITNISGQKVYSCSSGGNILKIPTVGFQPGIYVLQINFGNKTDTRKISIY